MSSPLTRLAGQAKRQNMDMQCDPQWVLDLAAQRDELLGLLQEVREELAIDGTESWIRALMARIDAALAKHGDNQC